MRATTTKAWPGIPVRLTYGIALLVIFGIALSLRIFPAQAGVFGPGWVNFHENDPWYHIRLVENLLEHFPQQITFDPYSFFPHGQAVFFAPLFDLLLALSIWVAGLGAPTQQTIETVAAYFPAVLGALVTLPVCLIGKELFNWKVGFLSALLVAILPGVFLTRSLLGFTDHHVMEVLFSTIAFLFLILAVKRAKENQVSFARVRAGHRQSIGRPLAYALLAGLFLGMYLLSWVGGLFLALPLFIWAILQYIIDHLRGESSDYLCICGAPMILVALLLVIPFRGHLAYAGLNIASLAGFLLAFPVLGAISGFMRRKDIKRLYYPLALAALGSIILAGLYLISPSLLSSIMDRLRIFTPGQLSLTISEARPLFFTGYPFSLAPAWNEFTSGAIAAPVALVLLTYATIKRGRPEMVLFLIWSAMMLAATLGQARFSYYFTVNVAILSGYFFWWAGVWITRMLRGLLLDVFGEPKGGKVTRRLWPAYVSVGVALLEVLFLAIYPNIRPAITVASTPLGPNKNWHDALLWMKANTPEPFQDTGFYYELYQRPPKGEKYRYPESAYGVMAWWDYGHWITEIAHRIPNSNPHQAGAEDAARFFTAQDESSANQILDSLGSKYIIIDRSMTLPDATGSGGTQGGIFYAMATWAGKSASEFFEIYYRQNEGRLEPVPFYYPEYYRTIVSRLGNFSGRATAPRDYPLVVSYVEKSGYKEILTTEPFHTYEDARSYLESQTSSNYRIVGSSPFANPVLLEKLEHYQVVHQSRSVVIFEYLP